MAGWNMRKPPIVSNVLLIPIVTPLLASSLLALAACSDVQQRTYDLSVTNRSDAPITVWLTKNGPPYEDSWLSPEDLVQNSPKMSDRIPGVQIDPGRTAAAKVNGQFEPDTQAILRVYATTGFDNILAMSRDQPGRLDLEIAPGPVDIEITGKNGVIAAQPAGSAK